MEFAPSIAFWEWLSYKMVEIPQLLMVIHLIKRYRYTRNVMRNLPKKHADWLMRFVKMGLNCWWLVNWIDISIRGTCRRIKTRFFWTTLAEKLAMGFIRDYKSAHSRVDLLTAKLYDQLNRVLFRSQGSRYCIWFSLLRLNKCFSYTYPYIFDVQ